MATLELVEKLREYAHVTYQEASDALDICNDDILEAILHLERQGKTAHPQKEKTQYNAHYSTQSQKPPTQEFHSQPPKEETFGDMMKKFFEWIMKWFRIGNTNHFVVHKNNEVRISIPITLLVILLLISFGFVFFLIILGFFFGFSYTVEGQDLSQNNSVNDVMGAASRVTDDIKNSVKNSRDQQNKEYQEWKDQQPKE